MSSQTTLLKLIVAHKIDWLLLVLLGAIDGLLNLIEPFHRYVNKEMMTDLTYPMKQDTIPMWGVPIVSIIIPILIFVAFYFTRKDIYDLHHAILGIMYASLVTGVITDSIKDAVGRPRPNFFMRCFPDKIPEFDKMTGDVVCHGIRNVVKEGYKSFPSGHSSWAFAGLCFLSWYLSGKIRVFDRRGHIAKLVIVFVPLLLATLIGITRVDDYWHHWTDVFAGAFLGVVVATICYLLLYPFPTLSNGWAPHAFFHMSIESECSSQRGPQTPRSLSMELDDMETGRAYMINS